MVSAFSLMPVALSTQSSLKPPWKTWLNGNVASQKSSRNPSSEHGLLEHRSSNTNLGYQMLFTDTY
jgi:hypothetical protein